MYFSSDTVLPCGVGAAIIGTRDEGALGIGTESFGGGSEGKSVESDGGGHGAAINWRTGIIELNRHKDILTGNGRVGGEGEIGEFKYGESLATIGDGGRDTTHREKK